MLHLTNPCAKVLSLTKPKGKIYKTKSPPQLYYTMKESLRCKHYASDEKGKTVLMKWFKDQSTEFYETKKYMLSFKAGKMILRETVTMFRGRDVIHSLILTYDTCSCVANYSCTKGEIHFFLIPPHNSIRRLDETLKDTTTSVLSGPENNSNEEILHIA